MAEFNFPGWSQGVNNVFREDRLGASRLRKAENVDLLPTGMLKRRAGYQRVVAGAGMRSLYSTATHLYFAQGEDLKRYDGLNVETVYSGLAPSPLSYDSLDAEVFFTDGVVLGRVASGEASLLAVPNPPGQPTLAEAQEGGLFAGIYQVAITYVSEMGAESGTDRAVEVEVPEGAGIRLSNIPQPEDDSVVAVRIYASDANGENLYMRASIPVGVASYTLGTRQARKKLDAMFKESLPAGFAITLFNGRLYVLQDNLLLFSDPLDYGRYSANDNYILLEGDARMLMSVTAGLVVGTDKGVFFYRGQRPDDFSITQVSEHAPISGTGAYVDFSFFNEGDVTGDTVAVWWATDGILRAMLPDGSVRTVRESELALPSFEAGSVAEVDREGVRQLVSVLKNPGPKSALAFEDSMEIEVHRNGIEL